MMKRTYIRNLEFKDSLPKTIHNVFGHQWHTFLMYYCDSSHFQNDNLNLSFVYFTLFTNSTFSHCIFKYLLKCIFHIIHSYSCLRKHIKLLFRGISLVLDIALGVSIRAARKFLESMGGREKEENIDFYICMKKSPKIDVLWMKAGSPCLCLVVNPSQVFLHAIIK